MHFDDAASLAALEAHVYLNDQGLLILWHRHPSAAGSRPARYNVRLGVM